MGDFFRSKYGLDNEQGFVQGAGRVLIADYASTDHPGGFEDLLVLTAGATQYDAVDPWADVGFTKSGINITRNNAEEEFDVDQQKGSLRRRPTNFDMSVGTQLAEATLETFAIAWSLPNPVLVTKTTPQLNERHMGLSAPDDYKERRVAVIFLFPDGILRAWVFRRCVPAAQESGFTLNKTGEQVSLPTRFNALTEVGAPQDSAFGEIFEQVAVP
jgi:hypothetical protein